MHKSISAESLKAGAKKLSPAAWLWAIAVAAILMLSVSHIYNDILITVKQSLHFWDLLFAGRPWDFYKESIMFSGNIWYNYAEQGAGYPFLVYLTFAVWNFPLWFVKNAVGDTLLNSLPCLVWVKGMLILAAAASACAMYRIARHWCDETRAMQTVFLFCTSTLLLSGTFIASQYDIVTVMLMLFGIDAWLSEKHWRFILFFGLAVGFKYFAFLVLIPILALSCKNLLKLLRDLVLAFVPSLLLQLPFSIGDSTRGVVMGSSKRLLVVFTTPNWEIGSSQISLFLLTAAGVCLWCYFRPQRPAVQLVRDFIFACLAMMGAFCLFAEIYPYWAVLAVPFFTLAAANAPEPHRGKALLCETAMCATIFVHHMDKYYWVYGSRTMLSMLWPRILRVTGIDFESFGFMLFEKIGITDAAYFSTIALCAWAVLLLVSYPRTAEPAPANQNWYDPPEALVFYVRFAVNLLMAFIPTIVFLGSVFEYYGTLR